MHTLYFSVVSFKEPSNSMLFIQCPENINVVLIMGPLLSIQYTLLQYMHISYFTVVSVRAPSGKILLFLWWAKINVVLLRVPSILLTRPFHNIWVSPISV